MMRLLLLLLLSLTCYGQVMTDLIVRRRALFEGTVDMSSSIMQFPRTTLNPSGGCAGSQVIFSLQSSTLWLCNGGSWVEAAGAGAAGVSSLQGLTGPLVMNAPITDGAATFPAWGTGGFGLRLGFPMANAAGVTGGLVSKAEFDTFIRSSGTYADPAWLTSLAFSKTTGLIPLNRLTTCAEGQIPKISGGAWVCAADGGSGGTDTTLQVTRVSASVLRVARGKWTLGGTSWTLASHDCTISGGTSTGPWRADTAQNGTVVLTHPAALTVACAVTSGDTVGVGELTVSATSVDPGTRVTPLASGTVTSGAIDTTVVDLRTPIHGQVISGSDGITASTTAGVTTVTRNPAIIGNISSAATVTGDWDFGAATRTKPNRTGSGAPGAGGCSSLNVGATYTDTANGGTVYNCLQTGAGVYGWVAASTGGGGGATIDTQGQGFALASPFDGGLVNGQDSFANTVSTPLYVQFVLNASLTLRRIRVHMTGATASASLGSAFAIYDAACSKITNAEVATIPNGGGRLTLTLSTPVTLPPGVYHLGFATETAATTFWQITGAHADKLNLLNETSHPRVFTGADDATGTGASLSMPAACGVKTAVTTLPILTYLMP